MSTEDKGKEAVIYRRRTRLLLVWYLNMKDRLEAGISIWRTRLKKTGRRRQGYIDGGQEEGCENRRKTRRLGYINGGQVEADLHKKT
jgi:hypothetical protein